MFFRLYLALVKGDVFANPLHQAFGVAQEELQASFS